MSVSASWVGEPLGDHSTSCRTMDLPLRKSRMPPIIVPRCLPSGEIAAILLGGSFMRLYVPLNQCQKRNPLSITLFWGEAVIVLRRALESMASSGN